MKYTGWCQSDFNVQGYAHHIVHVGLSVVVALEGRGREGGHHVDHLGVDVEIILATPCIFCMDNHLMKYTGW
jgi:hypothetical protein